MSTAQRIDTHLHVIPPRYAEWMEQKGVRPGGIAMPKWSKSDALRLMDKPDIATGVVSLSMPGVYFGEASAAQRPRFGLAVTESAAIAYIRNFAISWASARPRSRALLDPVPSTGRSWSVARRSSRSS